MLINKSPFIRYRVIYLFIFVSSISYKSNSQLQNINYITILFLYFLILMLSERKNGEEDKRNRQIENMIVLSATSDHVMHFRSIKSNAIMLLSAVIPLKWYVDCDYGILWIYDSIYLTEIANITLWLTNISKMKSF